MEQYALGKGSTGKHYTLWVNAGTELQDKWQYVRKLFTSLDESQSFCKEYIGITEDLSYHEGLVGNTWGKSTEKPIVELQDALNMTFKSGKHEGARYETVLTEDPSYFMFLAGKGYLKNLDILKECDLFLTQQAIINEENAKREAERNEIPSEPAPIGKQTVEGTIASFKDVDNGWSVTTKMLVVLDSKAKVWATAPSECGDVGDRIKFSANFQQSEDDIYFSFGKRPKIVK